MARAFIHPSPQDFTLDGVLYALADPIRREMVVFLMANDKQNCAACCDVTPASTISFHTKVLRECGLIYSEKIGVSVINSVRYEELNARFPGLMDTILKFHESIATQ
jgi:DNA-binding transcriptional ArsR family regulator